MIFFFFWLKDSKKSLRSKEKKRKNLFSLFSEIIFFINESSFEEKYPKGSISDKN